MEPHNKKVDLRESLQKLQPMLQGTKRLWIIAGSLLVLIGLIYLIGAFMVSTPEEVVADFKKAVNEKDVHAFEDVIHIPDETEIKMDEKAIQNLLTYFHEERKYQEETFLVLDTQLQLLEQTDTLTLPGSPADFMLQKVEMPLFYDTYAIVPKPYYLNLDTTEPDVTLHINGQKTFTSTEDKQEYQFGPVLPSVYDVKIHKKFPHTEVNHEEQIEAVGQLEAAIDETVSPPTESVSVKSEFPDTKILVNGKDSNQVVGDSGTFGPVTKDGSTVLTGQKQFPWGVEKSAPVTVNDSLFGNTYDLTPIAFQNKAQQKTITQMINTFLQQIEQAYQKRDSSVLANVHKSLISHYDKEFAKMKSNNQTYKGQLLGTQIAYDHAKLTGDEKNQNLYYVDIPVEVHNKGYTYSSYSNGNEPLDEKFTERFIKLQYNTETKKWSIYEYRIEYDSQFDEYMQGEQTVKTTF